MKDRLKEARKRELKDQEGMKKGSNISDKQEKRSKNNRRGEMKNEEWT